MKYFNVSQFFALFGLIVSIKNLLKDGGFFWLFMVIALTAVIVYIVLPVKKK